MGLLSELFLGRLMIHPDGFTSAAAFHVDGTPGHDSVIDTQRLFYDGNSQGGIMGGALAAVAPDFDRAALGVPAMNYSILLPRSVDYDPNFSAPLANAYANPLARTAAALDNPDALGSRGAERLRTSDDHRPAARHAGTHDPAGSPRSATTR